jgi:hypothetical protein
LLNIGQFLGFWTTGSTKAMKLWNQNIKDELEKYKKDYITELPEELLNYTKITDEE